MPRKPPPPHPRGQPRTPGSGRKKGTLNRKSIELKALMAMLVNDVSYQYRLRDQFVKRRVHPTAEALVWAYAVGRPVDKVQMAASIAMSEQLAAERALLSSLSIDQLEALAKESQGLIDRARAMAEANRRSDTQRDDAVPSSSST